MRTKEQSPRLPSHESLSRLACERPEAFEALRLKLIRSLLDRAPERIKRRLLGLQFRIDGIRRLSRSPLGAAIKMQTLMWESFLELNTALQDMAERPRGSAPLAKKDSGAGFASAHDASVIQFRPRPPQTPSQEPC